ncbi:hypothetical protein WYI_23400 [Ochrobactrum sp. CDB2]|nr:hypothetical protein WYI_23400 [Ochrobactrum sp. CDB2]
MKTEIISTWNAKTFTEDIHAFLKEHSETIIRYHRIERQTDEETERLQEWRLRPRNPFSDAYNRTVESLSDLMAAKTIRAFHFTRMVDFEVEDVFANGFYAPTTEDSFVRLSERVGRLVSAGHLTIQEGDRIFSSSPLNDPEQLRARQGFWMTTGVFRPEDSSVRLLLDNWGGEVGYFWIDESQDPDLLTRVQAIGHGRIFEIAVPLTDGNGQPIFGCYSAAKDIVNGFAQSHGFQTDRLGFDLSIKTALPTSAILAVHTEGEESYLQFGRDHADDVPEQ